VAATVRLFGLEDGVAIQVVRTLILLVGLFIAARIRVQSFGAALGLYLATIVSLAVAQLVAGTILAGPEDFQPQVGFIAANLIWLLQLTLLVGMIRAFIDMGNRVETEFERFLSNQDLDEIKRYRESALKDRQLAQFLHGHLQTRLNGVARMK
jgi:hypothetical protein